MTGAVHLIDAGDGASALLAHAVGAIAVAEGSAVAALGTSAGRVMLARGGLRPGGWASPPCGVMRLAARPLARAVRAACGGQAPRAVTCWSGEARRAAGLASCMRRSMPHADVRVGSVADALLALQGWVSAGLSTAVAAAARSEARAAIGARDSALVVLGAADAPCLANALRMLDVAGRAILAGADAHLVLPACMPQSVRTQRYARGLGLDRRLHIVEGAEWPAPWWHAADVALVTEVAPLADAVARSIGMRVLSAPGHASDESSLERRAAAASARDVASSALVAAARQLAQSAMKASAASA